jgi:hypothetical protein
MKLLDTRLEKLEERIAPGLDIGISTGIIIGIGVGGTATGDDTCGTCGE